MSMPPCPVPPKEPLLFQRSQTPLMQMITLHPEQQIRHRKQRHCRKQVNSLPSHKRNPLNPQNSYQCQCRPAATSKILANENVPHCHPNEKKFARILYNPTDYSKIRATNSSLPYSSLTISTKFSNTYCTSSNDILVFSGSVITFSNK